MDHVFRPLFDWRSAVASAYGPKQPTTRLVLLTLSLHMSPKGDSCFPSIDLLSEETGLSRRAVISHLAEAEKAGWISKRESPTKNGHGWRRMEYSATLPKEAELAQDVEKRGEPAAPPSGESYPQGGERRSKGGANDSRKVVNVVHPSSSVNSSRGFGRKRPPVDKSDDRPLWQRTDAELTKLAAEMRVGTAGLSRQQLLNALQAKIQ